MVEWQKQSNSIEQWFTKTGVWAKKKCPALTIHGLDPFRGEEQWWVPDGVVTQCLHDPPRSLPEERWTVWVREDGQGLGGDGALTFVDETQAKLYFKALQKEGSAPVGELPKKREP